MSSDPTLFFQIKAEQRFFTDVSARKQSERRGHQIGPDQILKKEKKNETIVSVQVVPSTTLRTNDYLTNNPTTVDLIFASTESTCLILDNTTQTKLLHNGNRIGITAHTICVE